MKATNNNKGKKKKLIRVQPVYTATMLLVYLVILLGVAFLTPIICSSIYGEVAVELYIFMCCIGGFGAMFIFGIFIAYLQFAEVDETEIIIRRLFHTIVSLQWTDIQSIVIQRHGIFERDPTSFLWLVIKTDKKDEVQGLAGINRRNKPPYCIVASKKNIEIIERFFEVDKTYLKIEEMVKENKRRKKAERKKDKK